MEEDRSVTGFSPSETAQLVPGVLSGKRLTLDNINTRLLEVEEVLAKLAKDYYDAGLPTQPVFDTAELFVTGGFNESGGLEEANEYLRGLLAEKGAEIVRLNDLVVHQDKIIDNLNDKLVAIRSAMGSPEWID